MTAPAYEHVVVQGAPGWVYELIFADSPVASDPEPADLDESLVIRPPIDDGTLRLDGEESALPAESSDGCCYCLKPARPE